MNKKLLACVCALLSTASFAQQFMIYNGSAATMNITYKIGTSLDFGQTWSYANPISAKIPADSGDSKNYVLVPLNLADNQEAYISVLSNELDDKNGVPILKSDYSLGDHSICGSNFLSKKMQNATLNSIVDIEQKGLITVCTTELYNDDI